MNTILLIEDDRTFSTIIERFLSKNGFNVLIAHDLKSGEELFQTSKIDLLLLDYRLPDGIGLDLIPRLRTANFSVPVIMITGFNDVRTAVKSMASGVFDYILKPVNPDELLLVIESALLKKTDKKAEKTIKAPEINFIKGSSDESTKLYQYVQLVAPTEMSVMIIGESGTGKEHIAREIHTQSTRKNKPFEAVDCGVLSKELAASELFGHTKGSFTGALTDKTGILERANGGTLFLDEIGNLSYEVQVKLLRTLQERTIQPVGSGKTIPIDIRLITATNENLLQAVADGQFREDIYHRINEFKIQLPALRNRGADLGLFVKHFISVANQQLNRSVRGISKEVEAVFNNYDWPGNLRELKNIVNRMVLLSTSDLLEIEQLPDEMVQISKLKKNTSDLKYLQEETEKEMIASAMIKCNHNKSQVARMLNIDRKTLYNKLEKYQLE